MQNKFIKFTVVVFAIVLVYLTFRHNNKKNILPLTKSWEKAVPHQEIPEGLTSLSAKQCGTCHQKHYQEWQLSTHAHAWTDLQFQAELKKESSPFMCINCHIPLQNQQEFIITGLIDGDIYQPVKEKNIHFDRDLQQEGINCASCHVRNNVIIGPTGTKKAPHKTVKNTEFLSEKLCISCHNAVAVITPTLACSFETGDEWKEGPYFKEKNCVSCHMEPVQRPIVEGAEKRLSHLHYFAGSGIPKFDTVETKMLNGLAFYPSTLKTSYAVQDELIFKLKLKNEHAGHKVPTGDPERFFNITFELKNKSGETLSKKTERIGEQWQWYPTAKKLDDNNLLPNEERTFIFSHLVEEKGNLRLSVIITKNRLNKESADYNQLKGNYPLFITVFNEQYDVIVK
ncbi:MAG: multiheme c-type cytochrome [Cyclobacteriaceae bacterium]|nr:multiheme c-type cytochrome [Cyclobacteriaceae bacterium]